MKNALGLVEIQGLSTAIEVADAMVKAANIHIIETENTRGLGYITVKVEGDVGAVTAAVNVGKQTGIQYGKLVSAKVIPRPSDSMAAVFCEPKPEPPKPEPPKPEPPKAKPEPPKAKPEPPKAKPEPPKAKPEPKVEIKLDSPGPVKAEPPKAKAEPEPPKAKAEPPKAKAEPEVKAEPKAKAEPEVKVEQAPQEPEKPAPKRTNTRKKK